MSGDLPPSLLRVRGFLWKEVLQIRRDPSSLLLAIVTPVAMLLLFGYGLSLNPREVPIALVVESDGEAARDLVARFEGTGYFVPVRVDSAAEALPMLDDGRVGGVVLIPEDFDRRLAAGGAAPLQLVLNGVDANRANLLRNYAGSTAEAWSAVRRARGEAAPRPPVWVQTRTWFNETNQSRDFLVPGLIVLVMTLIGTLLTALVIAREWERGTMEAILATPLRPGEFLLGKTLPYFGLGMIGLAVSVGGGVLVFGVPLRGSLWVLTFCSAAFLASALGLGLLLSARLKVQFVAAQIAIIAGFLPALFLSGLLFDLGSAPEAVRWLSFLVPARYFVTINQTLFMAGDVWPVILPATGALLLAALVFFGLTRSALSLRLQGSR